MGLPGAPCRGPSGKAAWGVGRARTFFQLHAPLLGFRALPPGPDGVLCPLSPHPAPCQLDEKQLVLQVPEAERSRGVGVAGSGRRGSAPAPSLGRGETSSSICALEHGSFRSIEGGALVSMFYSFCSIKN